MLTPKLNWIDRAIGVVSPRTSLRRGMARAALAEATRAYDGASVGRRTEGWQALATSADAENMRALPKLRNRSRDLTRNNPHARKALNVWVNNIVGSGIWPRAKTGDAALDKQANDLFMAWAKTCDADGQLDFAGLQDLMVREMVEGGEILIRRRFRLPQDGLPVPLQLQLCEGDMLDQSRTGGVPETGGAKISGVEFDQIGRRVAYWMFSVHPGNSYILPATTGALLSKSVPASEILHLYRKERTQVRGVPWCSATILEQRDLDDYEQAEMVRKKIEACVVAIVTGADLENEGVAPAPTGVPLVTDAKGKAIEQFEPGMIAYSENGKSVNFNNPGQSGGFPEYKKIGLHSIAAGYLIPYELLSGDLSEVNFTSARVGLVEFRRLARVIQKLVVIPMALQPIWDWFTGAAVLAGLLPNKPIPCDWDLPMFESVNPLDDASAARMDMRSGLESLFGALAARGFDPQAKLREIAEANALCDDLGLVFDSDPRKVSQAGIEQLAPGGSTQPQPPARPATRPPLRLA